MPGSYRTTTIDGWRFIRASSEYIDVYAPGASHPCDVINVFDYEAGETTLPFQATPARQRMLARRWLTDNRDNLADYMMI